MTVLCVSKTLTNNFTTTKTGTGKEAHWGYFLVSQKWWCKSKEIGGQCNILCKDLLTDFDENAKCGLKVYKIHGLSAWSLQNVCLDVELGDIEDCIDLSGVITPRRGF